jgi:hypothetical protein
MKRALIIVVMIAAAILSFPIRDFLQHWGNASYSGDASICSSWTNRCGDDTQEHAGGYYDCAGVADSKDCEWKP